MHACVQPPLASVEAEQAEQAWEAILPFAARSFQFFSREAILPPGFCPGDDAARIWPPLLQPSSLPAPSPFLLPLSGNQLIQTLSALCAAHQARPTAFVCG